jgi:hypothetical protein
MAKDMLQQPAVRNARIGKSRQTLPESILQEKSFRGEEQAEDAKAFEAVWSRLGAGLVTRRPKSYLTLVPTL